MTIYIRQSFTLCSVIHNYLNLSTYVVCFALSLRNNFKEMFYQMNGHPSDLNNLYFVLRSRGAEVDRSRGEVSHRCPVGQTGASGQEEGQTPAEVSKEL